MGGKRGNVCGEWRRSDGIWIEIGENGRERGGSDLVCKFLGK